MKTKEIEFEEVKLIKAVEVRLPGGMVRRMALSRHFGANVLAGSGITQMPPRFTVTWSMPSGPGYQGRAFRHKWEAVAFLSGFTRA